jgi:hypothetical protein
VDHRTSAFSQAHQDQRRIAVLTGHLAKSEHVAALEPCGFATHCDHDLFAFEGDRLDFDHQRLDGSKRIVRGG